MPDKGAMIPSKGAKMPSKGAKMPSRGAKMPSRYANVPSNISIHHFFGYCLHANTSFMSETRPGGVHT